MPCVAGTRTAGVARTAGATPPPLYHERGGGRSAQRVGSCLLRGPGDSCCRFSRPLLLSYGRSGLVISSIGGVVSLGLCFLWGEERRSVSVVGQTKRSFCGMSLVFIPPRLFYHAQQVVPLLSSHRPAERFRRSQQLTASKVVCKFAAKISACPFNSAPVTASCSEACCT